KPRGSIRASASTAELCRQPGPGSGRPGFKHVQHAGGPACTDVGRGSKGRRFLASLRPAWAGNHAGWSHGQALLGSAPEPLLFQPRSLADAVLIAAIPLMATGVPTACPPLHPCCNTCYVMGLRIPRAQCTGQATEPSTLQLLQSALLDSNSYHWCRGP